MAEITKVYRQSMEAARFIGKKYGDADRVDGGFGAIWNEWLANGWLDVIASQIDNNAQLVCEDSEAPIGLQRWKDDEPFEYWIGIFTPADTVVPEGFQFHDFPKCDLGVCWVYGTDVFFYEPKCGGRLMEKGYDIINDENDACWFFERFAPLRYDVKDEKGNVTLDICYFVK